MASKPIDRIRASAGRVSEARLAGVAWTPRQRVYRGEVATRAALSRAADDAESDPHALALAQLLDGQPEQAIATLTPLAGKARNSEVWNDLAAAHLTLASRDDGSEHWKDALAATDAALRLSPDAPYALFNRALIVERLAPAAAAKVAWQRYTAVEPGSGWTSEAEQHIRRLGAPRPDFRRELDRSYDALARGDAPTARELALRFPQETRTWGEVEILGRWAEAFSAGDGSAAAGHLGVVRALAAALTAVNGERLLADVSAQLAACDAPCRTTLAQAFTSYRRARLLYRDGKPAEAEPILRQAIAGLEQARSPMALAARYYLGNVVFDQYRIAEARAGLLRVAASAPDGYKALQAQVQWELGLCEFAEAHWQRAGHSYRAAARLFEQLGEKQNAAFLHGLIANVLERLGDFRGAWRERLACLSGISPTDVARFRLALVGATRAAMLEHDWDGAASLCNLELEINSADADPTLFADTLLRRATIELHRGDATAARARLDQATKVIPLLPDAPQRERMEVEQRFTAALVDGEVDPRAAVNGLTAALAFHQTRGRRMFVPDILLARSRAYRRSGAQAAAWNDLAAAVDELDAQRRNAPGGYERVAIFDIAREVFTDAVSMRLAAGDVRGAFQYADRYRGRVLLDALRSDTPQTTHELDPHMLPAGTAIVESILLPGRLITFVVERDDVRHVDVPVAEAQLRSASTRFTAALARGDEEAARTEGAALFALLFAPAKPLLGRETTLAFVPDASLPAIPFAALFDAASGRYLIEDYAVVHAPSAAVYLDALSRSAAAKVTAPQLLVIGNPVRKDAPPLAEAARETMEVAGLYASAAVLRDAGATRARFLRAADQADVIHFAGHAVAPESGPDAALLLAEDGGDDGRLHANEIAALHLRRPRVVVLAACATAAGERSAAEGAWSVARGFLAAGVPSVVATLWPVADADSRRFFVRLHQRLAAGVGTAEALQAVQIESIRQHMPVSLWGSVIAAGGKPKRS